jgi:hypothetical protein
VSRLRSVPLIPAFSRGGEKGGNRAEREDARLLGQNALARSAGPKRLLLGRSPSYGSEAAFLH